MQGGYEEDLQKVTNSLQETFKEVDNTIRNYLDSSEIEYPLIVGCYNNTVLKYITDKYGSIGNNFVLDKSKHFSNNKTVFCQEVHKEMHIYRDPSKGIPDSQDDLEMIAMLKKMFN